MSGSTVGGVRSLLRLEGFCVLAVCSFAYAQFGGGWGVFLACFLLPDLAMLGYLVGPRAGALAYNASHSYLGPLVCLALALAISSQLSLVVALIWGAHIGFDRALGYGLKYELGFCYTHLGPIGKLAREAVEHVPSGSTDRQS
ncbi:MAG: DUF4260 domain-containing protein [Rhodocyclaceae bacterium]|nr:DUF4260 domain-containing protein [Rhodocyclaceae bacterium]